MEFIVDKDEIRIKEIINDKYKQTRKRVANFYNNRSMSDKEIIEYLEGEIEQYRNRIRKQEEYIEQLHKQNKIHNIEAERKIYNCGIDGQGKDYLVTSYYKDGELIKEEIKPCE